MLCRNILRRNILRRNILRRNILRRNIEEARESLKEAIQLILETRGEEY